MILRTSTTRDLKNVMHCKTLMYQEPQKSEFEYREG